MRPIVILLAIAALASAQAAIAQGTSSQQDRLVAQLESRVAQLDSQLAGTGGPRQRADLAAVAQRQRLQDLIEKIRAGQQVSPGEIDRALGVEAR